MYGEVIEIAQRFFQAWRAAFRWNFLLGAIFLACLLTFVRVRRRRLRTTLWWFGLVGFVSVGLNYAWELRWLCDDAFISFHYADNLARRLGLVFNPGEKVEGYTNFLWTLLIAGAIRGHLDAGQAAVVLGLFCYVAAVVVTALLGRRLAPESSEFSFPIAGALTALNYSFASFATSGLETMFAALLITAALYGAVAEKPLVAGTFGIAATMAHPDHSVLYAGLGVALYRHRPSPSVAIRYLAPFAVLYVPYYLWRWNYYGDFFPNTFYAKSGGAWYLSQGFIYLLVCFLADGLWALIPLASVAVAGRRPAVVSNFAIIGVPAYLFYVSKVGGDFMLGRLTCSVVPTLAVLAEIGFRRLTRTSSTRALGALLLVLASAFAVRLNMIKPFEKAWHIADERTFYALTSFAPIKVDSLYFDRGKALFEHFTSRNMQPLVAVACVGMVAYLGRVPVLDTFGLTDRGVAHRPIAHRGRPGHEKSASPGYLFDRDVTFSEAPIYPAPYGEWTTLQVETTTYYMSRYDRRWLEGLRSPGLSFADVTSTIDRYLATPPTESSAEAACDAWFFSTYYFQHNEDPPRLAAFIERARALGALPPGAEELLFNSPSPTRWQKLQTTSGLADRTAWIETGTAFADSPALEVPPEQGEAFPIAGPFVDSFVLGAGDGATGHFQSPGIRLEGDAMMLYVGGGRNATRLRVDFIVDGDVIGRATGCNTELLGARIFDIRKQHGKTAYLFVVDETGGGWGHIIVGEVSQWKRR